MSFNVKFKINDDNHEYDVLAKENMMFMELAYKLSEKVGLKQEHKPTFVFNSQNIKMDSMKILGEIGITSNSIIEVKTETPFVCRPENNGNSENVQNNTPKLGMNQNVNNGKKNINQNVNAGNMNINQNINHGNINTNHNMSNGNMGISQNMNAGNMGTTATMNAGNMGTLPTMNAGNMGTLPTINAGNMGTILTMNAGNMGTIPTMNAGSMGTIIPIFPAFIVGIPTMNAGNMGTIPNMNAGNMDTFQNMNAGNMDTFQNMNAGNMDTFQNMNAGSMGTIPTMNPGNILINPFMNNFPNAGNNQKTGQTSNNQNNNNLTSTHPFSIEPIQRCINLIFNYHGKIGTIQVTKEEKFSSAATKYANKAGLLNEKLSFIISSGKYEMDCNNTIEELKLADNCKIEVINERDMISA